MAEKKNAAETEQKAPGNKLKWIILILVLLLLLGGAGGAAYYFLVYKQADQAEEAGGQEQAKSEAPASSPASPPASGPLVYHKLDMFTVNLASPGPARFLRVNMTVATHSEAVVAALEKYMPVIRNDLLSLLAAQEFATINTPEGKDALRDKIKERISGILSNAGQPSQIEDVLFTELVMQ